MYPFRSSALRWSFTPFVDVIASATPICRTVGGSPRMMQSPM
jgi:hypothetical protein